MPAVRKDYADFEDAPGNRVRCIVCSTGMAQDTLIAKTSISQHRASKKHKDALETRTLVGAVQPVIEVMRTALLESGALSLADRFLVSESDDKEMESIDTPFDPFHDITTFDNEIFDASGQRVILSAGEIPEDRTGDSLWKEIESLQYFDHTVLAQAGGVNCEDDTTLANVVSTLNKMGLDDIDSECGESEPDVDTDMDDDDSDWFPHGSKTMFMLDLLDNLPRLRLSDDHLKSILWVMRECGTPNVPSFYALRKKQAFLRESVGLKSRPHSSTMGNHFYMNHPVDLLALDWANPFVRKFIHVYPEITTTISETWQAAKYVEEVDIDDLSPMWADWSNAPHRHFYIKELAQCANGDFVIPLKWIVFEKTDHFDGYRVSQEGESRVFTIEDHEIVRLPARTLKYNFPDLQVRSLSIDFFGLHRTRFEMPHPVRKLAQGRPVFVLRIMAWADDVSGNRSKQYNAHMNMYIANLNLPHRKHAQEYFVRFCSTSPHASSLEQFDALVEDSKNGNWSPAYDCELDREILFQVHVHLLPADNPQQAQTTSNAGSNANFWCRSDWSGGNHDHRESDTGYHALFSPSRPRTPEETVASIRKQIRTACLGIGDAVGRLQTETGIKDTIAMHWIEQLIKKARDIQQERVFNPETRDARLSDRKVKGVEREAIKTSIIGEIQEELYSWVIMQPPDRFDSSLPHDSPDRKELRPGDHFNVLLRLRGLDPHRDSPCEILHTVLLGNDKYIWHETTKAWDKAQEDLFATRLQSSSTDGLTISPLSLQQLGAFHLDESLCSRPLFDLWKANGELGALLWYPEICDMDRYLFDLDILVNNVLDRWAIVDPARILTKYKLHVLTHIKEDVRRLGPAIIFSTEVFECWNAVFRLCSVLSNHQAPSHDIAVTLAGMERFKHQVSGGWWKSGGGTYIRAGKYVRTFFSRNKQLQRRLGWMDTTKIKPGTVKLKAKSRTSTSCWKESLAHLWTAALDVHTADGQLWSKCERLISHSQDVCKEGSWVFFSVVDNDKSMGNGNATDSGMVLVGRIFRILASGCDSAGVPKASVVVIEHFNVSEHNDPRLNMPILTQSLKTFITKPECVLFKVNAQHDCATFKCSARLVPVTQGRDLTTRLQSSILHLDNTRYILNMHALHNAHLIRETLPRHLTAPKPIFEDRQAKHREFSAVLQETGPVKRAGATAQAQATRAKNKKAKVDKQAGAKAQGG
ncbi:hypothetical protein D9615_009298 [Tricholomella constricta]|uniref:Uncharacterized protein n=1 Tax=Tricholomella constricta TaxID=117010 RepID=A0A8H5GX12_9AGAR|nr:hypothetical protein D9615_009298 [Tricholomella constricta]